MDKHNFQAMDADLMVYLKIVGVALLSILTIFVLVKTVNEVKMYSTIGNDSSMAFSKTITVPGHGEVDATPDLATFTWTVSATAKDIAGSQSAAAAKSNAAIAFLKAQGVKDEDISTQNYNTNEQYQNKSVPCAYSVSAPTPGVTTVSNDAPLGSREAMSSVAPVAPSAAGSAPTYIVCPPTTSSEVVGYTTSQTVSVKIHKVTQGDTRVSTLVSGVGKAGVKPSDVSFSFENPEALKASARSMAIANARTDADRLAKDLGVDLGQVIGYNDNNYGGGVMYGVKSVAPQAMDAASVPQLPVGQSTVTSDVNVTYTIR